jgi:hypothetical protein
LAGTVITAVITTIVTATTEVHAGTVVDITVIVAIVAVVVTATEKIPAPYKVEADAADRVAAVITATTLFISVLLKASWIILAGKCLSTRRAKYKQSLI